MASPGGRSGRSVQLSPCSRVSGTDGEKRSRFESVASSSSPASSRPVRGEGRQQQGPAGSSCPPPAQLIANIPQFVKLVNKDVGYARSQSRLFWDTFRAAVKQKHGHPEAGFLAFAEGGLLTFAQFQELCETLSLAINAGSLRIYFDAHLDGTVGAWSLTHFNTAVWTGRLDALRLRLDSANSNKRRVEARVDHFLRALLLEGGGESRRRRAVERFQQKLTPDFCHRLHDDLRTVLSRRRTEMSRQIDSPRHLERLACRVNVPPLLKSADAVCGRQCFQAYELEMFKNIFERIDRRHLGSVKLVDLISTVLLLYPEHRADDKFALLFRLFDDDEDGCMTRDQLLQLFLCAVVSGVIARGDQPTYDADVLLGDELSRAKARRLFDYAMDNYRLMNRDGEEDELLTFPELRTVMVRHPLILEELLPRMHSIMWALVPRPPPDAEGPPVAMVPEAVEVNEARIRRTGAQSRIRVALRRHGSKVAEPSAVGQARRPNRKLTEQFCKNAATRFRHALRGEWDAVNAMDLNQSSSQWSRSAGPLSPGRRSERGSGESPKLPALGDGGAEGARAAPAADGARQPVALEKSHSLPELRREGAGRGGLRPRQPAQPAAARRAASQPRKRQQTRFQNESHTDALDDFFFNQASAEDLRLAAAEKLAEAKAESAAVLEAAPALRKDQDGMLAFHRFRCYSEAQASGNGARNGNPLSDVRASRR